MNVILMGAVGGASAAYYAWTHPSSKIGQKASQVIQAVLPVFQRMGCFSHKSKIEVQNMLQEYGSLPRGDRSFMQKIMEIYARTLLPEQQDNLSQSQKENDADLISTVMMLSWRALLFSPDIQEDTSPVYLRSYRGGGDSWVKLRALKKEFYSLSYYDQHIFLSHPNPDDISTMPVTRKAKEVYRGIKAIADLYIQGNPPFNQCLGAVFRIAEERGKILEKDSIKSSTSATGSSFLFWLKRGRSRLEREFASYIGLPTSSLDVFSKTLLNRYLEKLSGNHRNAVSTEMRGNEFYARQVLIMLSIRALLCCPLRERESLCKVLSFFNGPQIATLKQLRQDFEQLSLIDQSYLFSSIFPPKDMDHPENLATVLNTMRILMNQSRENFEGCVVSNSGSSSSSSAASSSL